MPPQVGYAEINVETLENTTIVEDDEESDNTCLNEPITFKVEEIPPDNTEFHAGIKLFRGDRQIVVSNTNPLPEGAIEVDKVPSLMVKKKLVELSKYVPFD